MTFRFALLAVIVATLSCRQSPTYQGESLHCDGEGDCPSDLRCIDSWCVFNSPPVIAPLPPAVVVLGATLTVGAVVTDANDDPLMIGWEQLDGPETILADPIEVATFEYSPTRRGASVFEVLASDGFDTAIAQLSLTAVNEAPVLEPFASRSVAPGTVVTAAVTVSDADGHAIDVQWAQLNGPAVSLTVDASFGITFTASELGVIALEATPSDPFEVGQPQTLTVVVRPNLAAIYVSDLDGKDAVGCGTWDVPCGSVSIGLREARGAAPPIDTILVAAPVLASAYDDCLDLDGDEVLWGGFEPGSWAHRPTELRARTRVACDFNDGHGVAGDARVEDVTLVSTVGERVDARAVTVSASGRAVLRNVDVEAPSCGATCDVVGVAVVDGDATAEGVEVFPGRAGLGTVRNFTGFEVIGGTFSALGTASARTVGDGERGGVVLGAPVASDAVGLLAVRADTTVSGVTVVGGVGDNLVGFQVDGGSAVISGSAVELQTFGTIAAVGLVAADCAGPRCDCSALTTCGALEPVVDATGNLFRLVGAPSFDRQPPCGAAGFAAVTDARGQRFENNQISIEGAFSISVGVLRQLLTTTATSSTVDRIATNIINVEDVRASPVCSFLNFDATSGLQGAAVGMLLLTQNAEVVDNTVTVGGANCEAVAQQACLNVGLAAAASDNDLFEGNRVRVGEATAGDPPLAAAGVLLTGTPDPARPSVFRRNVVELANPIGGIALSMLAAPWRIENNYVTAGNAVHGSGLSVAVPEADASWPKIFHNTIVGADGPGARVSAAVSVAATASIVIFRPNAGVFANNLVDGGRGVGRRFVLNEERAGFASQSGNVAQLHGDALGPEPGFVAAVSVAGLPPRRWHVVASRSAEMMDLYWPLGDPIEVDSKLLVGSPTALWVGSNFNFQTVLAAGTPGRVEVHSITYDLSSTVVSVRDGAGAPLTAEHLAGGELDGIGPADLVFIDSGNAWWLQGEWGLGFRPAVPLADRFGLVAVDTAAGVASTVGSTRILVLDQGPSEVAVNVYPDQTRIDVTGTLVGGASSTITWFGNHPAENTNDIYMIANDVVVAFPDADPTGAVWTPAFFSAPAPCSDVTDAPVRLAAGRAVLGAVTRSFLLVQCGTSRIEQYEYAPVAGRFDRRDVLTTPFAVGGMAFDSGSERIALTNGAAHELVVIDSDGLGPLASAAIEYEVGLRRQSSILEQFTDMDGIAGFAFDGPGDPAACVLGARASGDLDDLSLDPSSTGCVDAGVDLGVDAVADDIDGAPRSDGSPDVGADEI